MNFKRTAILIQLTAMFLMACNGIFFTHSHHARGGNLITHAHPYFSDSDSPVDPGHSHSEEELEFLKFMGSPEYLLTGLCEMPSELYTYCTINRSIEYTPYTPSTFLTSNSGRAPPFSGFN